MDSIYIIMIIAFSSCLLFPLMFIMAKYLLKQNHRRSLGRLSVAGVDLMPAASASTPAVGVPGVLIDMSINDASYADYGTGPCYLVLGSGGGYDSGGGGYSGGGS